jgi:hypothetical protein
MSISVCLGVNNIHINDQHHMTQTAAWQSWQTVCIVDSVGKQLVPEYAHAETTAAHFIEQVSCQKTKKETISETSKLTENQTKTQRKRH